MERIKKKEFLNKDSLRALCDNIKCNNILIIGASEGEDREKGTENIYEDIIAEKFPNLRKETVFQVQKEQNPKQDQTKRGPY